MSDGVDWIPEAERYANGQMGVLRESAVSLTKAEGRLVRQLLMSSFIEGATRAMVAMSKSIEPEGERDG